MAHMYWIRMRKSKRCRIGAWCLAIRSELQPWSPPQMRYSINSLKRVIQGITSSLDYNSNSESLFRSYLWHLGSAEGALNLRPETLRINP